MKALIRNEGETVTEDQGLTFIDWTTGAPLTNAGWFGGPYVLVANYVAPKSPEEGAAYEVVEPTPAPEDPIPEEAESYIEDDTVVINGVRYTKEQLRQMLGE